MRKDKFMKKLLCMLLAALMVLAMAACEKPKDEEKSTTPSDSGGSLQTPDATSKADAQENTSTAEDEDWGVPDSFSLYKNGVLGRIEFCFPHYAGIMEGPGLIAYQADDTRVVVTSYMEGSSPEVEQLEEVLPAYCDQIDEIFAFNFGDRYTDSSYTVESKEIVTVGKYEMCRFYGIHSYQYEGTQWNCRYAAYAMFAQTNGCMVMWLVQDESVDQSLGETVKEYAYKMAQSVWEPIY